MIAKKEVTEDKVKVVFLAPAVEIIREHPEILAELEKGGFKFSTADRAWVAPEALKALEQADRLVKLDELKGEAVAEPEE